MMRISVNGEETDIRGAHTIAELVDLYRLPAAAVLVEHNGLALRRREWPQRGLADGDRIEIIRLVAGG